MMKKFEDDDRIEQMNAQKRRMKELEHKRQADALWQQKAEILRVQREKEEMEELKIKMEEARKKEIIERERQRMLEEFAPQVADYLPKGTLRSFDEKAYVTRRPK
jgi:GMP synthase PP-ATPase subunit